MSERRVYLASYWRSEHTSPKIYRGQYGNAAFHWAIVIGPRSSEGLVDWVWDVSDAELIDGKRNTNRNFLKRTKQFDNRDENLLMLGLLQIGIMDSNVQFESVNQILGSLSVPDKTKGEDCVTWTTDAINALRQVGAMESSLTTVECFKAGLKLADKCVDQKMRKILQKDLTKAEERGCVVM